MEHLAIMTKSWGLIEKIITGKKKIESRWYKSKIAPYDRISKGDTVYFKNSGEPVTLKAEVSDIKQFSDLTPKKVRSILEDYGELIGIEKSHIDIYFRIFKNKKYCILVFLKDPTRVKPFKVNKKRYGIMSSWICIEKIDDIRKGS